MGQFDVVCLGLGSLSATMASMALQPIFREFRNHLKLLFVLQVPSAAIGKPVESDKDVASSAKKEDSRDRSRSETKQKKVAYSECR